MAGIGTRKLKLEIDGVERNAELSAARITSGESDADFTTFADAEAGGSRDYKLTGTAVQDAVTGTIWSEIFDNAGTTVPYVFMPYGNAVPSATEPHFTGSVVISEPDGDFLGGEANKSNSSRMTFDIEWECTGKPVRVTTAV